MKYLSFLLIFLVLSCTKEKDPSREEPVPIVSDPIKREKGTVLGDGVTKNIGATGGFLELGGQVHLEVPPGAVEEPTQFSIQPISNTHDELSEKPAFRLLPEGQIFKKPVKITFNHDPLGFGNPISRMIAFQSNDGVWCGVSTALDSKTKNVSTTTTHFSDWVWFDQVTLRKDKESVGSGGEVKLKLMEQILGALNANNHIDSVPLAALEDIGRSKDILVKNWKIISGAGMLSPKINSSMVLGDAIYYAPHNIAKTEDVEIQVEVESKNGYIRDPKAPNGKRKFGKLFLLTKIRLEKETYFYLNIGGKLLDLSEGLSGAVMGGQISVGSQDEKGNHQVTLFCFGTETGSYPGGNAAGQSFLGVSILEGGTPKMFTNVYLECGTGEHKYGGNTRITSTRGFITGTYNGPVYYSNKGCGITERRDVMIDFKIKSI
ncbi:hypothetical protein [Sphingobacterium cellulitidis]|uniref:hypothetical protein n=1 Tax=Sphingobacterium cellulitidis TaxID=1768011 RepID=UPI000B945A67|nr:hypothetical protein CHT99_16870 [Sphingobacterium cellulitidis]